VNDGIDLNEQQEQARKIIAKYHGSLGELHENGTAQELRFAMMYIANESNHKQRVVAGLDKE